MGILKESIAVGMKMAIKLSTLGMPCRHSFSRHGMYRQIEDFAASLPSRHGRILDISSSMHLASVIGLDPSEVTSLAYPDYTIFNIPYPDNHFDWIVSDQCFEHLEGQPIDAIHECLRVLKPGGRMLHTTCFMTAYHGGGGLGDFWRFSPEGLSLLCRDATEVTAKGSGHPLSNLLNSFIGWSMVPSKRWHPLTRLAELNHRGHPAMVWVYARKPLLGSDATSR
ncbi:MAG: class I SAM-dependent methyltransferase [Xanthomonadales bacterium]|jgi:SAM-dependent methyltransferase|nr:class I SAM-dependent methyltransferase [Xanthomonadales bacterium]